MQMPVEPWGQHLVALHGRELLWLPHEYQPQDSAIRDDTVVIGTNSGGVVSMEFEV